jgi:hypothetical protein
MSLRSLTFVALLGLAGLALPVTTLADTYYRCTTGYNFDVDPNNGATAARCVKPASWDYKDLIPSQACGGVTPLIAMDRLTNPANKDQCINKSGSVQVNPNCGAGWEQDPRPGPDRCKKHNPEAVTFPNVPVQR